MVVHVADAVAYAYRRADRHAHRHADRHAYGHTGAGTRTEVCIDKCAGTCMRLRSSWLVPRGGDIADGIDAWNRGVLVLVDL